MMSIRAEDVRAFFEPSARADNDAANKIREAVVEVLLDPGASETIAPLLADAKHGTNWKRLIDALRVALTSFQTTDPALADARYVRAIRKSGRGHNFDFELTFELPNGDQILRKVEFKKGKSIHAQPQFLSLTASRGNVTRADVVSYREFFYDMFVSALRTLTAVAPPDRETYMRLIGRIDYDCHAFFEAQYREDKEGGAGGAKRSKIADRSAHEYLSMLERLGGDAIDWKGLGDKLASQVEKQFLSWSDRACSFAMEAYSADDLRLSGEVRFAAGRDGLYRYLVLPVASGHELVCMLRWRNHKAILNPAWQIRLKQK